MRFPRFSTPVAILLFLLVVLALIGLPALCAVDSALDEDTPPDTDIEAVPDFLE